MHPPRAEGLTHGPCPYPLDSAPAARWHLERSMRDAARIFAEALKPVTDAVAALERSVAGTRPVMRGATPRFTIHDEATGSWSVSPGPAMTYTGEDARHAATRRPPADPRLRGAAFRGRGRR